MPELEQWLRYLLRRYADQLATEEEINELLDLLNEPALEATAESFIEELGDEPVVENSVNWEAMWKRLKPAAPVIKTTWFRVAVAAILLLLAGGYLLYKYGGEKQQPVVTAKANDVTAPATNKTVLILADGRQIELEKTQSGMLATQHSVNVQKSADGRIVYNGDEVKAELFNTMMVPRGSQPQLLTLADGSEVWINVASSITYPVAFIGKERRVTVTGEVYIKVAKNAARPFIVTANNVDIQALGTEFNINAYTNEPSLKVTLVEGSVKTSIVDRQTATGNRQSVILKPGQQSAISNNPQLSNAESQFTIAGNIDVEEIVAWKDGFFHFESADLPTILRQFERWYDIEVSYDKTQLPNEKFFVIMKRNSTLVTVLKALQSNGIKYTIDGKKLTIQKM